MEEDHPETENITKVDTEETIVEETAIVEDVVAIHAEDETTETADDKSF